MKTLIILLLVILITGCSMERDYSVWGDYSAVSYVEINHVQSCVFDDKYLLTSQKRDTMTVQPHDTVTMQYATKTWTASDGAGFGICIIDTMGEIERDTITRHYQIDAHKEADCTFVTIYHAGVCTVSVW